MAGDVISKDISAIEARRAGPARYHSTGDAVTHVRGRSVQVAVDGSNRREVFRRGVARPWKGAFPISPTIVAAFDDDVDLLRTVLPHVAAVEQARDRIERHPPWVAQAQRKDLGPDRRWIQIVFLERGCANE